MAVERRRLEPESEWVWTLPNGRSFTLTGRSAKAIGMSVERDVKDFLRSQSPPLDIEGRAKAAQGFGQWPALKGHPDKVRMTALARTFPTLRAAPIDPWDVQMVLDWLNTSPAVTSGGAWAARFVMSVWRGGNIPGPQPFDPVRACQSWDDEHRAAFLAWAASPWHP